MRRLPVLAALLAAFVVGALVVAVAGTKVTSPMRLKVVEHATTDKVGDVAPKGDSSGDVLTFHNAIFDAHDNHKVGRDLGTCIRVQTVSGSWACSWTAWWPGQGSITVGGPFYDTKGSTLAITGGTGQFRNARGWMVLKFHNKAGTKFDFIYHVIP